MAALREPTRIEPGEKLYRFFTVIARRAVLGADYQDGIEPDDQHDLWGYDWAGGDQPIKAAHFAQAHWTRARHALIGI